MSPKFGNLEFSWISRRDRVGFSTYFGPETICTIYCATVSVSNSQSPNLPWLTSFDVRKVYPFSGGPARA